MTSPEERERRRKKLKRDAIARDLHSVKYRQRKMPRKRKGGRVDRLREERQGNDELP